MKLTKEEFIAAFKYRLCGMALFGAVSDRDDNAITKAARAYEIPGECEKLLASMYQSLQPAPAPDKPKEPQKGPQK